MSISVFSPPSCINTVVWPQHQRIAGGHTSDDPRVERDTGHRSHRSQDAQRSTQGLSQSHSLTVTAHALSLTPGHSPHDSVRSHACFDNCTQLHSTVVLYASSSEFQMCQTSRESRGHRESCPNQPNTHTCKQHLLAVCPELLSRQTVAIPPHLSASLGKPTRLPAPPQPPHTTSLNAAPLDDAPHPARAATPLRSRIASLRSDHLLAANLGLFLP